MFIIPRSLAEDLSLSIEEAIDIIDKEGSILVITYILLIIYEN